MLTWIFKHWNISKSWGGRVSFLGAVKKKKGWSNTIWSIVMWILLSHLGCWMDKCGSLCPDFCVLYFLGYVLLSMRRSFSLLHADQVENRLRFQSSVNHISCADLSGSTHRSRCACPARVFVRPSTSADKAGAMFMIWKLDAVFWTQWLSWIRILNGALLDLKMNAILHWRLLGDGLQHFARNAVQSLSPDFSEERRVFPAALGASCVFKVADRRCAVIQANPRSLCVFTFSVTAECSVTSHCNLCLC